MGLGSRVAVEAPQTETWTISGLGRIEREARPRQLELDTKTRPRLQLSVSPPPGVRASAILKGAKAKVASQHAGL